MAMGKFRCEAQSSVMQQMAMATKVRRKKKIKHRKHLCLSSVQAYFSNTSHTTDSSV